MPCIHSWDSHSQCVTCQLYHCDRCGAHGPDFIEGTGYGRYCTVCYDISHVRCCDCMRMVRRADTREVAANSWRPTDTYCVRCFRNSFFDCSRCGGTYRIDLDSPDHYSNVRRCRNCRQGFVWCVRCEAWFRNVCTRHSPRLDRPNEYSYRPQPVFYATPADRPDVPHVGVELEFAFNPETVQHDRLAPLLQPWLYFKRDSSVHTDLWPGVELVTHPFTEAWFGQHRQEFANLLAGLVLERCVSGAEAHAGMHCHISRTAFTDTKHIYRFMRLFYEDRRFTEKLSERQPECLAHYANTGDSLVDVARKVIHDSRGYKGNFRYSAVNLQPEHTVEVRIFEGTLSSTRFCKNVEVMFAAFHFTKTTPTKQVTTKEFVRWVNKHRTDYPNLARFLGVNTPGIPAESTVCS